MILEHAWGIFYMSVFIFSFFGVYVDLREAKGGGIVFFWLALSSVFVFSLSLIFLDALGDVMQYKHPNLDSNIGLAVLVAIMWWAVCKTMMVIVSTFARNKE